jgi:hypothetical protein
MMRSLVWVFAISTIAADPPLSPEYAALRAKAITENRPLIVWVGIVRPDIETVRADALHLHCASFPGATAPCAVVGRPAKGELWRIIDVPAARIESLRPKSRRVCGPNGCSIVNVIEY